MGEILGNIVVRNRRTINVSGAVLDEERDLLPDFGGIYFVFVGKCLKGEDWFRIPHPKLLYIGEAKDINARHNNEQGDPAHEHYKDFMAEVQDGATVAYAYARIDNPLSRKQIESALIFHFQPPINIKDKQTFTHPDIHISITTDILFPLIGEFDISHFE